MHQRMPHSRLARTLVLGAVLGIALACPPPALPPSGATTMAGRPECPHDLAERYAKADSTLVVLASGELVVPGWQSNVPEFNDCQRFRMRDVTTGQLVSSRSVGTLGYDSLFAVFAARNLDSVYAAAEASSNRRKGASDENGQLVESDRRGKSGTAAPIIGNTTSMNWTNGIIVGVVLAEGDYPYLGLRRGLNCVLLRRPAAGSYEARVVPVGKRDDVCLNLDSLRSRPSRLRRHAGRILPPVAICPFLPAR